MLGIAFWQDDGGQIPVKIQTAIKASTSAGAILGQVVFGWLADQLGRKRMYGIELIILIIATLSQSLSSPSDGITISGLLIFGRVMMGLGIGGDYPSKYPSLLFAIFVFPRRISHFKDLVSSKRKVLTPSSVSGHNL